MGKIRHFIKSMLDGKVFKGKVFLSIMIFALIFWIGEGFLHHYVWENLRPGTIWSDLLFTDFHDLWMRIYVVLTLFILAVSAQYYINKSKEQAREAKLAYIEIEQIFRTAADGMRIVDTDYVVKEANDRFCTLTGLNKDQIIDKKCYEVFPGSMCNTNDCSLVRILGGEERIENTVEKKQMNGKTVTCIVTATPFRGPDGKLIGMVENFKDITGRFHARRESKNNKKEEV